MDGFNAAYFERSQCIREIRHPDSGRVFVTSERSDSRYGLPGKNKPEEFPAAPPVRII